MAMGKEQQEGCTSDGRWAKKRVVDGLGANSPYAVAAIP
jgi:hypothetical protein